MKTARNALLLSVLVLAGCAKFPHEPVPISSRDARYIGENGEYRGRGDPVKERETTVGEYSRRDTNIQR